MLTAKQEKFVQNIIKGMSQADAYRNSYDAKNMSDKTIHEKASKLMSEDKVRTRLAELREKMSDKSIMTAKERLKWLTDLVNSQSESRADQLKAIDIMNKMQGEYTQRIEAEVTKEVTINIELSDDE